MSRVSALSKRTSSGNWCRTLYIQSLTLPWCFTGTLFVGGRVVLLERWVPLVWIGFVHHLPPSILPTGHMGGVSGLRVLAERSNATPSAKLTSFMSHNEDNGGKWRWRFPRHNLLFSWGLGGREGRGGAPPAPMIFGGPSNTTASDLRPSSAWVWGGPRPGVKSCRQTRTVRGFPTARVPLGSAAGV